MAKKKNKFERIADNSPTYERIGAEEISRALGADSDGKVPARGGSPFAFWALRSRLLSDVVSTGGRPGRKEAVTRKKVPMMIITIHSTWNPKRNVRISHFRSLKQ